MMDTTQGNEIVYQCDGGGEGIARQMVSDGRARVEVVVDRSAQHSGSALPDAEPKLEVK